jgi:acyl dehydratase
VKASVFSVSVAHPKPLIPTPPGTWRAYAGMLLRHRRGLSGDERLPIIGRSTGPVKLQPAWLAAYRALIGLPDEPAVLPPLDLQVAAAPLHLEILADRQFPFRAMGLVHLSQRVDQSVAVMPGSVLQLEAFTGRCSQGRRGLQFELITEARREGRLVWRGISVVLVRPRKGDSAPADGPVLGTSVLPPSGGAWSSLGRLTAPEDTGRRYARIAGDWNPIHQRAWLARRFGFDRAIVHGTWTLARAMAAAGWPQHEAYSLHANFRKPVLLPSTLSLWTQQTPSVQALRVTDEDGDTEHLVLRLEPAQLGAF